MKIAFLNIYNGIVERGSEVFVTELATRLALENDVTVFQAGRLSLRKYSQIQIHGIPIIPHQKYGRLGELIYHVTVFVFSLMSMVYLIKNKYDWIIPVNGRSQVIICRFVRFLTKCKILMSGHAGIGFDDEFNILFGKPDIFVALSRNAYVWAKRFTQAVKIEYIPNGIDLKRFNNAVAPIKVSLPKPVVLCVSALVSYKRLELLIEAVSILKEGSLIIIGDGELKEKVERIGNKMLGRRFLLIPHVSNDLIPRYYRCAKVFSLPSRESEAFGLVYLEALACNIPVVAPDDENRRVLIGDGGLYCDVSDTIRYSQTLKKAMETDFGNKPYKQAEKYNWNATSKQYEKLFIST